MSAGSANCLHVEARSFAAAGAWNKVEETCGKLLTLDSTDADALRMLAQAAVQLREFDRAIALTLDLLGRYPHDALLLEVLARARLETGNAAAAISTFLDWADADRCQRRSDVATG